jgi:hypothetical protein
MGTMGCRLLRIIGKHFARGPGKDHPDGGRVAGCRTLRFSGCGFLFYESRKFTRRVDQPNSASKVGVAHAFGL